MVPRSLCREAAGRTRSRGERRAIRRHPPGEPRRLDRVHRRDVRVGVPPWRVSRLRERRLWWGGRRQPRRVCGTHFHPVVIGDTNSPILLWQASKGLTMPSETDAPFEVIRLEGEPTADALRHCCRRLPPSCLLAWTFAHSSLPALLLGQS